MKNNVNVLIPTPAMKRENLTMSGLIRNVKDCIESGTSFDDWANGMKIEYDLTNAHIKYVKSKIANSKETIEAVGHVIHQSIDLSRLPIAYIKKATFKTMILEIMHGIIKDKDIDMTNNERKIARDNANKIANLITNDYFFNR